MPKAVVLFSGGLDSTTCLALAIKEYGLKGVYTLSFKYGQTHQDMELKQAGSILDYYGIPNPHRCLQELCFVPGLVESTLLTPAASHSSVNSLQVLGAGSQELRAKIQQSDVPAPTYVPGRNLLFVAYGNMLAENVGAESIYLGVNQVDCSGYPDCREGFVKALDGAISELGFGVAVEAPLVELSKAEISRLALELKVPVHMTHSCYVGQRPACGTCDACLLRLKGFSDAGLKDPLEYAK